VFQRLSIYLGIGGASYEFALPGAAEKFIPVNNYATPGENDIGHTCYLDAFEHRVVHPHVVGLRTDRVLALRIEDHEIGVATD